MKFAEIKYELTRRGWPKAKVKAEAKRIEKSAKEIAKSADVPVEVVAKMILERIRYVANNSGTGSPGVP